MAVVKQVANRMIVYEPESYHAAMAVVKPAASYKFAQRFYGYHAAMAVVKPVSAATSATAEYVIMPLWLL